MKGQYAQEKELLLRLSGIDPHAEPVRFDETMDWGWFLQCAGKFAHTSLIARNIKKTGIANNLPEPVVKSLSRSAEFFRLREIFLLEELKQIAGRLNEAGCSFLLLKGPDLSLFYYPEKGLRDYADLDLLVRREDFPAAAECLKASGYLEKETVENEVNFVKAAGGTSLQYLVEIHFDLLSLLNFPYYARVEKLDLEEIWNRARSREINGVPTRVLCPEDTLLYCCIHFFYHHNFRGLRYLTDIDAIVRAPDIRIDYANVRSLANEYRLRNKLFLVLDAYKRLFPTSPLPQDFLDSISPPVTRAWLLKKILPEPEAVPFGEPGKSHHLPMIFALDRLRDMLYVVYFWFFPGKKFLLGFYRIEECNWKGRFHLNYACTILLKGFQRLIRDGEK
jgi:hypothetical protein